MIHQEGVINSPAEKESLEWTMRVKQEGSKNDNPFVDHLVGR